MGRCHLLQFCILLSSSMILLSNWANWNLICSKKWWNIKLCSQGFLIFRIFPHLWLQYMSWLETVMRWQPYPIVLTRLSGPHFRQWWVRQTQIYCANLQLYHSQCVVVISSTPDHIQSYQQLNFVEFNGTSFNLSQLERDSEKQTLDSLYLEFYHNCELHVLPMDSSSCDVNEERVM